MSLIRTFGFSCLIFVVTLYPLISQADPVPGDIFREYRFVDGRGIHLCTQGAVRDSETFVMNIDDLQGALKAEVTGYFHTGHIGTSERRIQVNGGNAVDLPLVQVPSGHAECYFTYVFGRPGAEIPLKDLKPGANQFTFSEGPQICHGFNWPCYGFHSFIVRIYYDQSKPHPTGEIQYPKSGQVITNDALMIKARYQSASSPIASLDIVGYYYDYPFEGHGVYQDWHYFIDELGRWFPLIDRNKKAPYHEIWNLKWLPDQPGPMKLTARITDMEGMSYMTPAVENLVLKRETRSVKMYKATEVPENFKARIKETKKCRFEPITDNLQQATEARLASIIPIGHMENKYLSRCGVNDVTIKEYSSLPDLHTDFFYDTYLPIRLDILKQGVNDFFIYSDTEGHMTEVCWPGPAILVSFNRPAAKKQ